MGDDHGTALPIEEKFALKANRKRTLRRTKVAMRAGPFAARLQSISVVDSP
jgi:hypothetical protein